MSANLVAAGEVIDNSGDVEAKPQVGGVRLNLGCNQRPRLGYVNVDIVDYPGVDVVTDLEKRWPWDDDSVDEVTCADLPEHIRQWWEEPDIGLLEDARIKISVGEVGLALNSVINALRKPHRTYGIIHFMNEAYRVLKIGGLLDCLIPSTDIAGRGAWQDPTHVSYWNESTLLYFCNMTGNFRGLYPDLIKANFTALETKTYMPNPMGVTYLHFVCRKD